MSAPGGPPGAAPGGFSGPPPPEMFIQRGSAYGGRGPIVMAVVWSFTILTTFLVLCRLYVRVKRNLRDTQQNDWALWLALLSWSSAFVSSVLVTVACIHGFGNHIFRLSLPNLGEAIKFNWLSVSLAAFSSGVAKASVAAFLLAMQGKSTYHKKFSWILHFMLWSNIAVHTVTPFIIMFQCNPPAKSWNPMLPGECPVRDSGAFSAWGMFQSSYSAISDLILAFYPILILHNLQISIKLKVFLCCIMGLGVIAGAISWVRLAILYDVNANPPTDPTFQIATLTIWGHIELWVVLLALSIPPVWPLVKPYFENMVTKVGSNWSRKRTGRSSNKEGQWTPMKDSNNSDPKQSGIKQTSEIYITTESQTDLNRPPPAHHNHF